MPNSPEKHVEIPYRLGSHVVRRVHDLNLLNDPRLDLWLEESGITELQRTRFIKFMNSVPVPQIAAEDKLKDDSLIYRQLGEVFRRLINQAEGKEPTARHKKKK